MSILCASCRSPSDRWFSLWREGGLIGLSMVRLRGGRTVVEDWETGVSKDTYSGGGGRRGRLTFGSSREPSIWKGDREKAQVNGRVIMVSEE